MSNRTESRACVWPSAWLAALLVIGLSSAAWCIWQAVQKW